MIKYKIDIYDEGDNLIATHRFSEASSFRIETGVLVVPGEDTTTSSYGYKNWGRYEVHEDQTLERDGSVFS